MSPREIRAAILACVAPCIFTTAVLFTARWLTQNIGVEDGMLSATIPVSIMIGLVIIVRAFGWKSVMVAIVYAPTMVLALLVLATYLTYWFDGSFP